MVRPAPGTNDSGSTSNIAYLYCFRTVNGQNIISERLKIDSHILILEITIIDGCLESFYQHSQVTNQPIKKSKPTHKLPPHNSIIAHAYTSIYDGIMLNSYGCAGKIQIWIFHNSGRGVWMDPHVMIGYFVHWNQLELELVESVCLWDVGVVEKAWMILQFGKSPILARNLS